MFVYFDMDKREKQRFTILLHDKDVKINCLAYGWRDQQTPMYSLKSDERIREFKKEFEELMKNEKIWDQRHSYTSRTNW